MNRYRVIEFIITFCLFDTKCDIISIFNPSQFIVLCMIFRKLSPKRKTFAAILSEHAVLGSNRLRLLCRAYPSKVFSHISLTSHAYADNNMTATKEYILEFMSRGIFHVYYYLLV